MAYDPTAPTYEQRSRAYKMMFVSAGATPFAIACYFLEIQGVSGFITGLSLGGLLASALAWRADEYFRSLCSVGHRWLAMFIVIYAFGAWLMDIFDVTYTFGMTLASDGEAVRDPTNAVGYFRDGQLMALVAALVFFAGYVFAWARDRFSLGQTAGED